MASLPALHAHWDDVLRHGDDDDVPAMLSKPAPRGAPMLSTPSNSVHELHSGPTMPAAASGRMAHLGPAPAGPAPAWVPIPSSVGMIGADAAGHPVYHYGPGAPAYCPPSSAPGAVLVPAAAAPMVYAQPGYAPASHVTAIVPRPDGGGYFTTSTPCAPMMASAQPPAVGAKEVVSASRDLADGLVRQSLDAEAAREASRASMTATSVEMPASTGKRRRRNGWSSEEDGQIIAGYNRYGPRWRAISAGLPGRSDDAVRNRWLRIYKVICPQQPRAESTAEPKSDDDEPPSSAASTASASGSALQEPVSKKQKRKPATRQGWNVQEDSIIVQGVHTHCHRWNKIAEMLPTPRTEHAIRNRWHRLGMAAQDGRGGALDAALQIAAAREMLEKQQQRMEASSPVEGDALPSNPLASSLPPADEGVVVGNAVEGETSTFDDDLIGGLSSAQDDVITPAIA